MKIIKRDLFYKLIYDSEIDCYFIYLDDHLIYRFYSRSENRSIEIYDNFRNKGLEHAE